MKTIAIYLCFLLSVSKSEAQAIPPKKTAAISEKVIQLLKHKQADSIYALAGKSFREKITAENFTAILTEKVFPITGFESIELVNTKEDISKYRIKANPPLQLLLGFDADNKIQVFTIQEYVPD